MHNHVRKRSFELVLCTHAHIRNCMNSETCIRLLRSHYDNACNPPPPLGVHSLQVLMMERVSTRTDTIVHSRARASMDSAEITARLIHPCDSLAPPAIPYVQITSSAHTHTHTLTHTERERERDTHTHTHARTYTATSKRVISFSLTCSLSSENHRASHNTSCSNYSNLCHAFLSLSCSLILLRVHLRFYSFYLFPHTQQSTFRRPRQLRRSLWRLHPLVGAAATPQPLVPSVPFSFSWQRLVLATCGTSVSSSTGAVTVLILFVLSIFYIHCL